MSAAEPVECERCGRRSKSCRELTVEESGIRVRDSKTGAWRAFIACPPCALSLCTQSERARRRFAQTTAPRMRKVPRKAIAAIRDALGIEGVT